MMATVPHVTSGLGLRKFQADEFLLTRVYILSDTVPTVRSFTLLCIKVVLFIRRLPKRQKDIEMVGRGSRSKGNKRYFDDIQSVKQKQRKSEENISVVAQKNVNIMTIYNNSFKTFYLRNYKGNRRVKMSFIHFVRNNSSTSNGGGYKHNNVYDTLKRQLL